MPAAALRDVVKRFGDVTALDGVSLDIAEGRTTALVGPSGSGKTTLLELLNGLTVPGSGRVEVLGAPIDYAGLPALRRRIGYAVQGTGLFPHLTAWRNLTMLARLDRWSADRIEQRGAELLRLLGLDASHRDRYPHELSGGQQQRVGLGRAMMLNPPLVLLDEAFGALDPMTRGDLHVEFLRLKASEPRTMVLVTHDLREALKLADWIVVLNRGRVEQEGPGDSLVRAPATDFVRDLFRAQLS